MEVKLWAVIAVLAAAGSLLFLALIWDNVRAYVRHRRRIAAGAALSRRMAHRKRRRGRP